MENITQQFSEQYTPQKAILIYQSIYEQENDAGEHSGIYVESYDIGKNGNPINAHPLTIKEMLLLSDLLQSAKELQNNYFTSREILSSNILHIEAKERGNVIWYTPAQEVNLFFSSALGIPNGKAFVPAMVWKAGREDLSVYALKGNKKPTAHTKLFHAPFFNIYKSGKVCMGTVDVVVKHEDCLEDFITKWEGYFWNSYFSHLMEGFTPVKGNIVQLWKQLVETNEPFPVSVLKPTCQTIENLLP